MVLTGGHFIYIFFMLVVLVAMIMRRDTVIPCILGVLCLGLFFTQDVTKALVGTFNSLIVAFNELGPIILIIAIMVALSKTLEQNNAISYMVNPFAKVIKNESTAFFVIGIVMLVLSWFFWPSPAVALVGAIFLPVAIKVGLPAMGVAVALNLFGHGIALSTDFIIQGSPGITSSAAGISITEVISEGMILFIVMSVVTVSVAFYMLRRDMKNGAFKDEIEHIKKEDKKGYNVKSKIATLLVLVGFGLNIVAMYVFKLKGGDASALLGGTALLLVIIINVMNNRKKCLENVCNNIVEGFSFGMKIFGIIIPIAAFFYMGEVDPITASFGEVLHTNSQGLLSDIGIVLSQTFPLNKLAAVSIETIVGAITGLDGSSFSGMSLAGSLASVFGNAIDANIGALTALGQIAATWVGGGCLVPWAVIPAAAITGVNPIELAKRNFIPVMIGLAVTTVVAIFII